MAKRRLTKQQISRIKQSQQQRIEQGKLPNDETDQGEALAGTVVSHFGQALDVEDTAGNIIHCKARQNLEQIVCGDQVVWHRQDDGSGVISAVKAREAFLSRTDFHGKLKPVAANVDQVIIVCASKPELREALIDQYIIATEQLGIRPAIVLNKIDLLDEEDLESITRRLSVYSGLGYSVSCISAKQHQGFDNFENLLENRTSILVGQSGVGKSTIIKHLLPHEDIEIGALSHASGKGKHTTTVSRLYHLPTGGDIIDSPGVRDFGLGEISRDDLLYGFIEFRPYLGACKFKNCTHINEPGCALLKAVESGEISQERYDSYLQIAKSRF